MLATLSYVLITYFMTAQPLELIRISSFIFVCVLISLTAQSFGLIIGAIMSIQVSRNMKRFDALTLMCSWKSVYKAT